MLKLKFAKAILNQTNEFTFILLFFILFYFVFAVVTINKITIHCKS